MRANHLRSFALPVAAGLVLALVLVSVPAHGQRAHWGSPDNKTVQYIVGMERQWAEGVCVDNGVVAGLLAEDFQGTSPKGLRFTKADELRDEKGAHIAHDCGLDEAKVRFFGDSTAVVYGREHAVGKDGDSPTARVCQVWTDTWLKRGGKWQIVASQDNRVECR